MPRVSETAPEPRHQVRLDAQARFLLPRCSCGWIGTARMTAAAAREEARDHALLYADYDIADSDIADGGMADSDVTAIDGSDPAERDPSG